MQAREQTQRVDVSAIDEIEEALARLEARQKEAAPAHALCVAPKKQGYEDAEYWDKRYGEWGMAPFDWLVGFEDIEPVVNYYFSKDEAILCPGCGNAPFHPEMYDAGFTKQICLDTSSIVIEQSIGRYSTSRPEMVFEERDCLDLSHLDDCGFSCILDKSLIDTLRCETGAYELCDKFIGEMYRLLTPGGTMITISLNSYSKADVALYFKRDRWDWDMADSLVRNPNYTISKDNSEYYTIIVCRKAEDHKATFGDETQEVLNNLCIASNARYVPTDDGGVKISYDLNC